MCIVTYSCKDKNLYPDISKINVSLNLIPFYEELGKVDTLKIQEGIEPILNEYPEFTEAYSRKIIKVGVPKSKEYYQHMYDFLTYNANKDIYKRAKKTYPNYNQIKKELEQGFRYYKYYFKEVNIPDVYLMISGFSQSIAVDSLWVGVSVEKYLGEDCEFYEWLQIPIYLRKGMIKEKMASDVIRAIALTNYGFDTDVDDLINNMVYKGKIKYFVHRMFPDMKDSLLFDYSSQQMKWCKTHEEDMWASMVEWKHLFNNDRMLIQKYTEDAPFTANFGNNSAPRAGEFLGYKIVEAYMKNNLGISVKELMDQKDGRKILAASNYRP